MLYRILIICIVCGLNCYSAKSQLPAAQQQAIILKRQIQQHHYGPAEVDDSLSSRIFFLFVREMDEQHDLFTSDEYKLLEAHRYSLDDELNGKEWKFLDLATGLYKKALLRADSIIKEVLKKSFDFSKVDHLEYIRKSNWVFPQNSNGIRSKWEKWFKYNFLNSAYSIQASDSSGKALNEVLTANEMSIREKLRKGHEQTFRQLLDSATFPEMIKEKYFSAVAAAFDPHTNYLSPQDKEIFQEQLSTEEYSFGFEMDETKEGKIVIGHLIPGGPAWKTGEIHKNDELLQLQWKGKPVVDMATVTFEEAEDIMYESGNDELTVKVRKTDGTIRTVVLRKEKIETEDDVVKGFLLSGEKKIGYISLPDFYTTWEDESGSGCANDMAKEIIKMKRENLDGLILDVRYNGGGSLYEALQLCGIFIDEGPLVGIKNKEGKQRFDKDPNRGIIFDGPLLLLVNNQSASASEMLAAALQDYNRAVIAGSSTFGKATMQQLFPMDSSGIDRKDSPNGFIKITTGKLYRLTGETAQRNGVVPDIILPDAFEGLELQEKFMPFVLPADTAKRNIYYTTLPALPVAALSAASAERVKNHSVFQTLIQGIQKRTANRVPGKTIVPLQPAGFEKWIKEREEVLKALDESEVADHKLFIADNYRMEKERLRNNVYAAGLNAAALKSIQHDIYIQEAYLIITDLIKLQKTK